MPCFALLDDCEARPGQPRSRLYDHLVREHRCTDAATLDATCRAVAADQARGLHAVLLIDYEWGLPLQRLPARPQPADANAPALRALMFRALRRLDADQVTAWLAQHIADEAGEDGADTDTDAEGRRASGVMDLQPSVDRTGFGQAIARIHEAIARGETYQVNYTYRLHGQAYGSPVALYQALRAHQPVPYGALMALPARELPPCDTEAGAPPAAHSAGNPAVAEHVLSCSPELFLRHEQGLITARPMKGTAARRADAQADAQAARDLAADIKNRAENLMIVDLLRNDLGRVAQTGSMQVPALFAVEPYATVWQMTSTVQARLRPGTGLAEVLRATFPCGSITGAPKRHTMGLIGQLEHTPRGLYCGAIGWLDAPGAGAAANVPDVPGDFCLSVAIRTLTLGPPSPQGLRPLRLGVGAGIVKDSVAADEFDECRLKARFLTGLAPGFALIETLCCQPSGELPLLQRHLDRLQRSAGALGFVFDRDQARERLRTTAATLCGQAPDTPHRLRLALRPGGALEITWGRLAPLATDQDGRVGLLWPEPADALPARRPLSAHKTTLRAAYDAGVRRAEAAGAFDTLFFTPDGRLVEGGRSSVFVRLDGRWYTPPLADGALDSVMRAVLLDDPAWRATERSLGRSDLHQAEDIVVCNALRGVLPARLLPPDTGAR